MKHKKNVRNMHATAIVCTIVFSFPFIACAKQKYTKSAEMLCGGVNIRVVTECYDDSYPPFPFCNRQQFELTNKISGKTITVPNIKLEYLASSMQCLKGKTSYYLLVMYYNGGNCNRCEWAEILDLKGNIVATDWPKTQTSIDKFSKAWKKLGLKEPQPGGLVPDSQYKDIPLRRGDK